MTLDLEQAIADDRISPLFATEVGAWIGELQRAHNQATAELDMARRDRNEAEADAERLRAALRHLLHLADGSWELGEGSEGWRSACQVARVAVMGRRQP